MGRIIILEIPMETMPHQSTSEFDVFNTATRTQQCPLITVRQAAQRLGRSNSTVYRIDRNHGPFRFGRDGRMIFVELDSFETYLATIVKNHSSTGTNSEQNIRSGQDLETATDTQSPICDPRIEAFEMNAPKESLPISASAGQRELFMRASPTFCVITYQSFLT